MSGAVDIAELVASAKLGKQHVAILAMSAMMLFIDGFDMSTAGVAAPSLLHAFHGEKSAMGTIFGASYAGILVGCWTFGYVGDRWGRKAGSIWSCLVYAIPSLLITQANSLDEILYLRFLVGIGLGGVMPTTLALLAESAPKRYRASFAMTALFGFPAGGAVVGQVGAHFIPSLGWPVVFYTAGIGGLALSLVLVFCLPESLTWLALNRPDAPALLKRAQRLAPELRLARGARFTVQREEKPKGLMLAELFRGRQRLATILLWTAYFVEGLTYITLANWMAVVLQDIGLSPFTALSTVSYASAGGIFVSLCLMRPLDKIGAARERRLGDRRDRGDHRARHAGPAASCGHSIGDHRAFLLLGNAHVAQRHGGAVLSDAHSQQRHRLGLGLGPRFVDHRADHRWRHVLGAVSPADRALSADAALRRADRHIDPARAALCPQL